MKKYGFRKYVPRQAFNAKLDGPLMSMGASGSIGGILTFGTNKGRNFVRQLVIPSNPQTAPQMGVRSMMKYVGQEWSQLSSADQATWAARAAQTNISNFAAFSSKAMDNWSNAQMAAQRQDPAETVVTPSGPPTVITDTVVEKRATIAWTDSVVGTDPFGVIYYQSPTTGFTAGRDNAVAVVDLGVLSFTTKSLLPGNYFYRLATFDVAGNIGTPSAEGTFTIV